MLASLSKTQLRHNPNGVVRHAYDSKKGRVL